MKLMSATLVAILVLPTAAAAQNSGVFIQGGAAGDVRFAAVAEGTPGFISGLAYTWTDLNGDRRWQPGEESNPVFPDTLAQSSDQRLAPGGSVAIGAFVTPSVSLRFEGSLQGQRVSRTSFGTSLSGNASVHRETTHDYIAAAGWHQGQADRVSLTYLAGLVFRRHHSDTTQTVRGVSLGVGSPSGITTPITYELPFEFTSYSAGVMTGLDVTLPMSKHLAAVPQFRMVAGDNEWNLRLGVVLQWRP